jgi:hypothetical protein
MERRIAGHVTDAWVGSKLDEQLHGGQETLLRRSMYRPVAGAVRAVDPYAELVQAHNL